MTAYVRSKKATENQKSEIAGYAIRLAKLDTAYRAMKLDPQFEDADPLDIADLLAMLAIVPFDSFLHPKILLLNPVFKDASPLVGGREIIFVHLVKGGRMAVCKPADAPTFG